MIRLRQPCRAEVVLNGRHVVLVQLHAPIQLAQLRIGLNDALRERAHQLRWSHLALRCLQVAQQRLLQLLQSCMPSKVRLLGCPAPPRSSRRSPPSSRLRLQVQQLQLRLRQRLLQ